MVFFGGLPVQVPAVNGVFIRDAGEGGISGITPNLYRDIVFQAPRTATVRIQPRYGDSG